MLVHAPTRGTGPAAAGAAHRRPAPGTLTTAACSEGVS